MANSNKRVKKCETVHHLVSRIAHRVYFLKEDERKDFLEIVRRAAEFTGIRLIGWCVMGNHFHILAYLPSPESVDEDEILRRMRGRRVCEACGSSFNMEAIPPRVEGICDNCGGKLIQRKDDTPETVHKRLEVYHKETEPLKAFYAERGLLRSVDNQPSVEAVSEAILSVLGK